MKSFAMKINDYMSIEFFTAYDHIRGLLTVRENPITGCLSFLKSNSGSIKSGSYIAFVQNDTGKTLGECFDMFKRKFGIVQSGFVHIFLKPKLIREIDSKIISVTFSNKDHGSDLLFNFFDIEGTEYENEVIMEDH